MLGPIKFFLALIIGISWYWPVVGCFCFFFLCIGQYVVKRRESLLLFPPDAITGPTWYPLIGNLHVILAHRENILKLNVRRLAYFDYKTVCAYLYGRRGFQICCPKNVEHILKTNFANYPKGPLIGTYFREILGHGIFAVDGESWHSQRKTASHMFKARNLRDCMLKVFLEVTPLQCCGSNSQLHSMAISLWSCWIRRKADLLWICKTTFFRFSVSFPPLCVTQSAQFHI